MHHVDRSARRGGIGDHLQGVDDTGFEWIADRACERKEGGLARGREAEQAETLHAIHTAGRRCRTHAGPALVEAAADAVQTSWDLRRPARRSTARTRASSVRATVHDGDARGDTAALVARQSMRVRPSAARTMPLGWGWTPTPVRARVATPSRALRR